MDVSTEDQVVNETPDGEAVDSKPEFSSLDDAVAKIKELQAEHSKNAELLKKVRKYEKENKDAAEKALAEQGKYKELYEAELTRRQELEGKARNRLVDNALSEALKEAGAKSVSTVLKLVDKTQISVTDDEAVDTKSIKAVIKAIRESDPILFEEKKEDLAHTTPPLKRPSDGNPVGGYETELRSARNNADIEKIMRKYGKLA